MKTYKIIANSDAVGTHEGTLTKRLRSGKLKAGTVVCFDADSDHIKACPLDGKPWGVLVKDAKKEEPVAVQTLTACSQTALLRVKGAVHAGDLICLADQGLVQALPSSAGTYTLIGLALTDGENEERLEALTTLPHSIEIK